MARVEAGSNRAWQVQAGPNQVTRFVDPQDVIFPTGLGRNPIGRCGCVASATTGGLPTEGDENFPPAAVTPPRTVQDNRNPNACGRVAAAMAKGVPAAGENRETEGDDSEGELVEAEWDDRGMCERDLREEAVSMEHLLCQYPKKQVLQRVPTLTTQEKGQQET